jgi:hypothetical protein
VACAACQVGQTTFGIDPALISIVQFASAFGTAATVALCAATGVAVPGACGEELGWRCFLQPTPGPERVPSWES